MSLKIQMRQAGGAMILDLDGRITLGEGSGALRDAVQSTLAGGQKSIILNMGNVSYVDSAGLGELVGGFTTVANQGGELKLMNVQKKMKDLMQITKLYTVFSTYENEADAVASFANKSASA